VRYGGYPVRPLEWLAFALRVAPIPILDVVLGPLQARTLLVLRQAGVLERLAGAPDTTEELARSCGLDADGLRLALRVLRAMSYVRLGAGELWSLSPRGEQFFGARAAHDMNGFVGYAAMQWRMIEHLDEVLRTGRGIQFHEHQSADEWRAYQRAMLDDARSFAPFVAQRLPVPAGARLCLDLAGAHGLVGAELCRRHAGLRSTVVERSEALPEAMALANAGGWDDVVSFREGDLLHGELGEGADVVLLCNILHHFAPETNVDILRRARAALRPGGTIGIFDIEPPRADARADAAGDGFALFFRIISTSGCYPGSEYVRWLDQAGFARARVVRSVRIPSRMLITART